MGMDAQYSFVPRDDIWRMFEEIKELHAVQFEHGERLARLERRRDEDARLKSVWGPLSPLPTTVGNAIHSESAFHSAADAFRTFEQGPHNTSAVAIGLDGEDEPKRGASRANSVRFDESAIVGHYGQASRSTSDLPLRTGSGLGGHPLTERSLSHRSDGRPGSSAQSHHSVRTNSLGLETLSRMQGSSAGGSPLIPPAGLFLLGPVPGIIRCWLTTDFSNESLLYAAVCTGSYVSSLGYSMIQLHGLEQLMFEEDGAQYIKLPIYLPEASIAHASPRAGASTHPVPAVTTRFLVREVEPSDISIQIVLGSDVLRFRNADILFSKDKLTMIDDDQNRISLPLVRPENDAVFKALCTASSRAFPRSCSDGLGQIDRNISANAHGSVGIIGQPYTTMAQQAAPNPSSSGLPSATALKDSRQSSSPDVEQQPSFETESTPRDFESATQTTGLPRPTSSRAENAGVWASWRRDSKLDFNSNTSNQSTRGRTMKVLRPSKSTSRVNFSADVAAAGPPAEQGSTPHHSSQPSSRASTEEPRASNSTASNPIGGASAFGWLNSSIQPVKRG